jgi:mannose-1-phosphate guanylyltransferase/phosphomannomutase
MKAFVLCGGLGTRLRPYTYENPKPMLKIGEKPILQYVIEHLKEHGFDEIVITAGYLNEKIVSYFGDGKKFGVKITYSIEKEAKNTAGSILEHKGKVREPFLVIMGDAITDINLKELAETHKKKGAVATVAVKHHITKVHYGVANLTDGYIKSFQEKPEIEHYINIGIYIFSPRIFDFIKEKEDFAKDVFPRLLKEKQKIAAYKMEDGVWVDIGRLDEYEKLKDGKEIKQMLNK